MRSSNAPNCFRVRQDTLPLQQRDKVGHDVPSYKELVD